MRKASILDRNGEIVRCGDVVMIGSVKREVIEATLNGWTFLIASSLEGKPKVYRLALISRNYIQKCV